MALSRSLVLARRLSITAQCPTGWRSSVPTLRNGFTISANSFSQPAGQSTTEESKQNDANWRTLLPSWSPTSKRTGALGMKVGMLNIFDEWGVWHAATVVQLDKCEVVQTKRADVHGFASVQVGIGERKDKHTTKALQGHFRKAGVQNKFKLSEFRVSEDALLPPGTPILAQHFVPGQYVDVCSTSKGKGFQGVMKRHNFAGQGASHGVSKTHRHAGSTGQCQDPGRIFKGKKMAGRLGGKQVTVDNIKVLKIDTERNLLYLGGAVPGCKGGIVRITDARKKPLKEAPPFPTYFSNLNEETPREIWAPAATDNPLAFRE